MFPKDQNKNLMRAVWNEKFYLIDLMWLVLSFWMDNTGDKLASSIREIPFRIMAQNYGYREEKFLEGNFLILLTKIN